MITFSQKKCSEQNTQNTSKSLLAEYSQDQEKSTVFSDWTYIISYFMISSVSSGRIKGSFAGLSRYQYAVEV